MAEYAWVGGTDGTWNETANWSPSGTPGAGDSIILDGRATRALTGNPTGSPKLALIRQFASCRYAFGTGAAPIAVGYDLCEIGVPSADGSSVTPGQFHINPGTNNGGVMTVYATASQGTSGQEPVTLKTGTPASGSHALYVMGGRVGVATGSPADVATVATITCTGGQVNVDDGCGWTTITVNGTGKAVILSGSASGDLIVYGGEVRTEGSAVIDNIEVRGGKLVANHRVSGGVECATLVLAGGELDVSQKPEAFSSTATTLSGGTIRAATPTQVSLGTVTVSFDGKSSFTASAA